MLNQSVQSLIFGKIIKSYSGIIPHYAELELVPEKHLHLSNLKDLQQLNLDLDNCFLRRLVLQIIILIDDNNLATLLITYIITVRSLVTPGSEVKLTNTFLFGHLLVIGIHIPLSQVNDDPLQGDRFKYTEFPSRYLHLGSFTT